MVPTDADKCLHNRYDEDSLNLKILIYLDNIFIMAADPLIITKEKHLLNDRFKMKYMGFISWFLGLNVVDMPDVIYIKKL